MREIKFRAFNGKEMITPTAVINGMAAINKPADDDRGMTDDEGVNYYCNWDMDVVTDYPLMQYTGLKDQNGVEIYEGDIVHVGPAGYAWSVQYDDLEACFIVFNQLNSTRRFDTDFTDPECPIVTICEGMEFKPQVIGNIYENKELIK